MFYITQKIIMKRIYIKSLIIIVLSIISTTQLNAQRMPKNLPTYDYKTWHFGFTLGFNTMDFILNPVERPSYDSTIAIIQPAKSQGFNIGIVANRKLTDYLDLRFVPTLSFGQRNMKYIIREFEQKDIYYNKTIESTFIDIPISIKYKSKRFEKYAPNMRSYIVGGFRYSYDLASQRKKKGTSDDIVIKLDPHDFMFTTGVGLDFYLSYFKLGVELRMAYGLLNVLNAEKTLFTTNVDHLNSKMTWITFTFE